MAIESLVLSKPGLNSPRVIGGPTIRSASKRIGTAAEASTAPPLDADQNAKATVADACTARAQARKWSVRAEIDRTCASNKARALIFVRDGFRLPVVPPRSRPIAMTPPCLQIIDSAFAREASLRGPSTGADGTRRSQADRAETSLEPYNSVSTTDSARTIFLPSGRSHPKTGDRL